MRGSQDDSYVMIKDEPWVADQCSRWDAQDTLAAEKPYTPLRIVVLPPGYDADAFAKRHKSYVMLASVLQERDEDKKEIALDAMLGKVVPGHAPVTIKKVDGGYDLMIAGRKAGGAHTAEHAIENAKKLISGELSPQVSWLEER